MHDGDVKHPGAGTQRPRPDGQGVLPVQPHVRQPGQHTVVPETGAPGQFVQPRGEHRLVAAELVDQVSRQPPAVLFGDDAVSAEDRRQGAPAVDVGGQHHGQPETFRQAEVDVVAPTQVDLGGRPGSLAQHQVVAGGEFLVGFEGGLGQVFASAGVLPRPELPRGAATEHDETAPVAARFQQHGIQQAARLHAGGLRLQVLGSPDLGAVRADHRVVGHVLRLERGHPDPAAPERARQARHDQRLARIRCGSRDQQPGHFLPPPNTISAPASSPVAAAVTAVTSFAARRTCGPVGRGPSPRVGRNSTRSP